MAAPGNVTLGSLRLRAQQESDMVNSSFVSTSEWNSYLSASYKELYDLLVGAYGNEYYVATPYQFTTDGTSKLFSLPTDLYKLLGVDLQIGNSQNSYVSLKPYNFPERNKYAVPNIQAFYGYTNLRYKMVGTQISFNMIPVGGQVIQLWYVPEPTPLQVQQSCSITASSTTGTATDGTKIASGNSVDGTGIPSGTTVTVSTNTLTFSQASTVTNLLATLSFWSDSTLFDGISGWEEYVVIDAAMKAMGKEESDVSLLLARKSAMLARINDMAEARDAGEPMTVSDSRNNNLSWGESGTGWDGSGGNAW